MTTLGTLVFLILLSLMIAAETIGYGWSFTIGSLFIIGALLKLDL